MPVLSCTARTCVYNKDEWCSKGDIEVGGRNAAVSDETCCKSFVERKESTRNCADTGCACQTISVECKACDCTFNTNERCHADEITIAGTGACKCDDTRCGSFCKA